MYQLGGLPNINTSFWRGELKQINERWSLRTDSENITILQSKKLPPPLRLRRS